VTVRVGAHEHLHATIWQKVAPITLEVTDARLEGPRDDEKAGGGHAHAHPHGHPHGHHHGGGHHHAHGAAHPHGLLGAKSDEAPIDDEAKALAVAVKGQIETQLNKTFAEFHPIAFRKQVVAGLNFFVTIGVGAGRFIHVTIWKKLDGTNAVTDIAESGEWAEVKAALPGGVGAEAKIDDDTKALVIARKAAVEAKANAVYAVFEPVSARKQVVAGLNHFVKIRVGDGAFIHATIWQKVDGTFDVTAVATATADAAL